MTNFFILLISRVYAKAKVLYLSTGLLQIKAFSFFDSFSLAAIFSGRKSPIN
ncbi:UNVERIFIED_ORG: hypothetical protein ABIC97_000867 [Peribacillus simplex]